MIGILSVLVSLSSLLVPIVDMAVKGAFVFSLAWVSSLALRRDSAATRHHVLATAVVLVLAMPFLSLALPRWSILPNWIALGPRIASSSQPSLSVADPPSMVRTAWPEPEVTESIDSGMTDKLAPLPTLVDVHARDIEPSTVTPVRPEGQFKVLSQSPWSAWAVLGWLSGCGIVLLRFCLSMALLRRSERAYQRASFNQSDVDATDLDALRSAIEFAAARLQLTRPVRLLLDPQPSIPLVWGVLQPRLRMPAESLKWSVDQQRSVLLHELAHVRRNDLLVLLLTQLTCALHWFNPLAWFVAWRLHVERERACDDRVLIAGVRPSDYAGQLVDIVSRLPSAPWRQSCGLAMARKSMLEIRLHAVLNPRLNRSSPAQVFVAAIVIVAIAIGIPIAMLHAMDQQPPQPPDADGGPETQTVDPTPPATSHREETSETTAVRPQHEYAQSLFNKWQARARADGKIPGALIGHVASAVENFISQYPDLIESQKLAALRSRFDSSRDWSPVEVVALLDAVTAVSTAPVGWADVPMRFDAFRTIKPGQPLPPELQNADWGEPAENGLRSAWLFEPRADQYAFGTVLKVRVLFHNLGQEPLVFRTETWHQDDQHQAVDAKGAAIEISGTWYTGVTPLANYRLLPGEYCEVSAPGVAIGAGTYEDERSTGRLGTLIEAQVGDEVTLSHTVDVAQGIHFSRPDDPQDPVELWQKQAADRVASEAPLPKAAADRELLLRRVLLDLTGLPPTPEEIAQFVNDSSADALDRLVARIQAQDHTPPWTGKLPTGITKFRVTAADPEAAKRPRCATGPGRYVLADGVHLFVSQTTTASRRENQAKIVFFSPDPQVESPHKPYEIALPDGLESYAFVWERGAGTLILVERASVRRLDFTDPTDVKESPAKEGLSPEYRALLTPGLLAMVQSELPTSSVGTTKLRTTKLPPTTETQLDWGEAVNGLRAAIVIRSPQAGAPLDIFLAVQNVSQSALRFTDTANVEGPRELYVSASGNILFALTNGEPPRIDVVLQSREVTFLPLMHRDDRAGDRSLTAALIEGIRKDSLQTWRAVLEITKAPAGAWAGRLATRETRAAIHDDGPQPRAPQAQALYKVWQNHARLNGDIPGGLLRLLHDKVSEFVRNNRGADSAKRMAVVESRFAVVGDWKAVDVVALLDDIATAHTIPLKTTLEHIERHTLQRGMRLPASLKQADWGEPLKGGLRMAYVLEPRPDDVRWSPGDAAYHLGTALRARLLLHNSGAHPVVFVTTSFQQPEHSARLADAGELQLASIEWTTLGRMEAYRLAPNEFCEVHTPGLGIGPHDKDLDDWSNARVGTWIHCAAGDQVVFAPGPAMLAHRHHPYETDDGWLHFITERLEREAPVPRDTREREYLLYRVVRELFGTAPYTTEGEAFAADQSADALKNLAVLLSQREYITPCHGQIRAGVTTFRVLPPRADASERARVVNSPGWYTLSDQVGLFVTRQPRGDRVVNEASLIYQPPGQDNRVHRVELPDGFGTWAAAWSKGAHEVWFADKGQLRRLNFADPANVAETRYQGGEVAQAPLPNDLRDVLRAALIASTESSSTTDSAEPPPAAADSP